MNERIKNVIRQYYGKKLQDLKTCIDNTKNTSLKTLAKYNISLMDGDL